MATPSFKSMQKDGTVKRADAMKIRHADLHVEPGFNLRMAGDELQEHIRALTDHIKGGGQIPALEVRPRQEGGAFIVDGHCRHAAMALADSEGAAMRDKDGELWCSVVPFVGNDADRTARILTSNEGRKLSQLEIANGYKVLAAFGWDAARIAKTVGKTRSHVDQLLLLSSAPSAVHALVADGSVSATVAINSVRDHGDDATNVLDAELVKAKAQGKTKVTNATMRPDAIPASISLALSITVERFIKSLSTDDLVTVEASDEEGQVSVNASMLKHVITAFAEIEYHREKKAKKARESQVLDANGSIV